MPIVNRLEILDIDQVLAIPQGRFAYLAQVGQQTQFIWIKDYTTGKRTGSRRIRTMHGPSMREALTIRSVDDPYTRYYKSRVVNYTGNSRIEEALVGIICDKFDCARRFASELGHCARCNLPLTVDYSRWYGIGPECTQLWPWFEEQVDNMNGGTFDELRLSQPELSLIKPTRSMLASI